jgi:hypothetical protein
MYAVVVRERGQADQINTSGQHVQANVLPRARQASGIVSGLWMTDMAGATLNVMVFESEDAARSALEPVRTAARPPSMQVESVDVYEVLAHSCGAQTLLRRRELPGSCKGPESGPGHEDTGRLRICGAGDRQSYRTHTAPRLRFRASSRKAKSAGTVTLTPRDRLCGRTRPRPLVSAIGGSRCNG